MSKAASRRNAQLDRIFAQFDKFDDLECPEQLKNFLSLYYSDVSEADLAERRPQDLLGAAMSHFQLARQREPKTFKVRVFNPITRKHGWHSLHTVVETVADDMPFLVDSVSIVAQKHGLTVHQTVHPVLNIVRDEKGNLVQIHGRNENSSGTNESFIHMEIDRTSGQETLEAIRSDISRALADTHASVQDWTSMRERAMDIRYGLDNNPPPIDPDEIEEGREFLDWLTDNHFTFLGYREYSLETRGGQEILRAISGSGLGILRKETHKLSRGFLVLPRELKRRARDKEILIITKANSRSTVHRPVYLDYIGFKRFDENGEVVGERRFLGLFTSTAYSYSPREIPIIRLKVHNIMTRSRLAPTSHAGKALLHILETLPRDELFQASENELYELAIGILHIQERSQVRLFIRRDAFGRFYSCLIYVPRERYNSTVRERMQTILSEALGGQETDVFVHMGESRLARVHLIIHTRPWQNARIGIKKLEKQLSDATRTWVDNLQRALVARYGEEKGLSLYERYANHFPLAYQEEVDPTKAPHDIRCLESLGDNHELEASLYSPAKNPKGLLCLKVFCREQPIIVSDILPILENMGLKVIAERPYDLQLDDSTVYWIHDFDTVLKIGELESLSDLEVRFREAFIRLWNGTLENDAFNGLILEAGLNWRQALLLRAYAKYLLQTGMPFGQSYIERVVTGQPEIAAALVQWFEAQFDPQAASDARESKVNACREAVYEKLDALVGQDEDRILRAMAALIEATLRTNYYQLNRKKGFKKYISFKLDPHKIPELPLPLPLYEIWVYAPHVEAVHLRGGRIARGGIRWSDRMADFRTEVLGLMKAQMVKNTVIIPVGAKGGFIVKNLPDNGSREEIQETVEEAYRDFIRGLLDITDNIKDDQVVPPDNTVIYDDEDTYLVVAADKGTATFSDTANEISAEYNFWLGDAFASGGSVGYDHKKIGITAKGAWESVKRLFGEVGLDPEKDDFTVIGIGDMAGDVFGNGLLLSRHIKLVAAFNHMHIFIDPNPNVEDSFAERQRLFDLPRSTWEDYDKSLISKGGGVYKRTAKSIQLADEARQALNIEKTSLTPQELIKSILEAPVDLLWNGGIGTYVKSSRESHSDVGDRANDAVRINGNELRCRVVGEGGNLGFTQLGRIEYALSGGKITTDFIDNSAGVDCSDHEVNIKILLNVVARDDKITEQQRRELLAEMTPDVCQLVLRDNYMQSLALSVAESQSVPRLNEHAHLIRILERQGYLNRQLEYLPDEEALTERRAMSKGLSRPELAVLLSYAKIAIYNDLIESDIANDSYLRRELQDYFPALLQKQFSAYMPAHRLQGAIVATAITNSMVNRMGPNFAFRIEEETGAGMAGIARAYTTAREALNMLGLWRSLENLGNQIPAALHASVVTASGHLVRHSTRWILEHRRSDDSIRDTVEAFSKGLSILRQDLQSILPSQYLDRYNEAMEEYCRTGLPQDLASWAAALPPLFAGFDIVEVASHANQEVDTAAKVYFLLGEKLELEWLRQQIENLPADDHWKALARATLRENLYAEQRKLTVKVLTYLQSTDQQYKETAQRWIDDQSMQIDYFKSVIAEIKATGQIEFSSMSVALQEVRKLAQGRSAAAPETLH